MRPVGEILWRLPMFPLEHGGAADVVAFGQLIQGLCRGLDLGSRSWSGAGLGVHLAHVFCSCLKDSSTPSITSLAWKSAQLLRGI